MPSTSMQHAVQLGRGASRSVIQRGDRAMKSAVTSDDTSSGTPRVLARRDAAPPAAASPRHTTMHAGSLASTVAMPTLRAARESREVLDLGAAEHEHAVGVQLLGPAGQREPRLLDARHRDGAAQARPCRQSR